jgi:hypothetical protein
MSRYYSLVAELPTLTFDSPKPPLTLAEFKAMLTPQLSEDDKSLFDLLYLKYDNANLLSYLHRGVAEDNPLAVYSAAELKVGCEALKSDDSNELRLPEYMASFLRDYYVRLNAHSTSQQTEIRLLDDRLASFYYNEATKCHNAFLASWFETNLNIFNLFASVSCRKHGLERAEYIVGDNEVAQRLRQSSAREVALNDLADYFPALMHIAEEHDLLQREKRLELFRWEWLEERTYYKTFHTERLITYFLQLEMLERWSALDAEAGGQTFRQIVGEMKQKSAQELQKFAS